MSQILPDFEPYNDITISDEKAISEHNNLITQFKYEDATARVTADASLAGKGFRSSFFNIIENKIKELQIYFLNKMAAPEDYYSLEEPDLAFMKENNKTFWIKPLD